jgi:hypothetical protein
VCSYSPRVGRAGFEFWWGGGIFLRHPVRSWAPPSLLQTRYQVSLLGVKRLRLGVDCLPLSSAEVKEREELYLYFPSGCLWSVLGRIVTILTLHLASNEDRCGVCFLYVTSTPIFHRHKLFLYGLNVTFPSPSCSCMRSFCKSFFLITILLSFLSCFITTFEHIFLNKFYTCRHLFLNSVACLMLSCGKVTL